MPSGRLKQIGWIGGWGGTPFIFDDSLALYRLFVWYISFEMKCVLVVRYFYTNDEPDSFSIFG